MTTSVRELLALPEWAATVQVFAGAAGLDSTVDAVRPVPDPGHPHRIAPRELLVVANSVRLGDWRIDALVRRIADAGGVGILLRGDGEPLDATRLLSDRLTVPMLVTTDAPLDLLLAARIQLSAPEVEQAGLVLATHDAFGGRLLSPERITGIVGDLLRTPAGLLDDRGEPLAGTSTRPARVRVNEPVPQRVDLADGVLLAQPIRLPGAARPTLWLVAELRGAIAARADVTSTVLEIASDAVQRWLLAHRVEAERDAGSRAALLGDLLRLDGDPTAEVRTRAAEAGWRLGGWHVGIRLNAPSTIDHVARVPAVTNTLSAHDLDAVVVAYGDGWTGWITFDQEPTASQVRALASRLRAAQRELRQSVGTHMGVGRPYARPVGLASTVADATDAARLAATRPEKGHFLHADQLGMSQLLLEWTRTDTFGPTARALLEPLRGQAGDPVLTLATYLDAESSVAETAAVLGVHRNTITARINKIERSLGVDLSDRDERLALHLACRTVLLTGR